MEVIDQFRKVLSSYFMQKKLSEDDLLEIEPDVLYQFSLNHSVSALTLKALSYLDIDTQGTPFKDRENGSIQKHLLFVEEYNQFHNFLGENGIWHMPLKGLIISSLYPSPETREMSDCDVLVEPKEREKIRTYFKSRGYEIKFYGNDSHDVYTKYPVYNFEIHQSLFQSNQSNYASYYEFVSERLIPSPNGNYEMAFTTEDFYIYLICHMAKHYQGAGTGLRSLTDVYVYLTAYPAMDYEYIRGELDKLGLTGTEEQFRLCAMRFFSESTLTDSDLLLLSFLSSATTYGTRKNAIKRELQMIQGNNEPFTEDTKLTYLRQRMFPKVDAMKSRYPILKKLIILLPVMYLVRLGNAFFTKREEWKMEKDCVNRL